MFSNLSSTYASPMGPHTGVIGHASQFPDSPLDSTVPKTPSVQPQYRSLDQSVPLTPIGPCIAQHESPQVLFRAVPNTPVRVSLSTDMTLSKPEGPCCPCVQKSLRNSTPSQVDQLVPTTPKNLCGSKERRPPITEHFSSSSPLSVSPMPYWSFASSSRNLYDSLSPVQHSPVASSSFIRPFSSTAETVGEDSGYQSTSSGKRNTSKSNESRESRLEEQAHSSTSRITKNCSSEQDKSSVSRKCPPPSRRRLSLGRQRQEDTVQRAAYHNLTCHQTDGVKPERSAKNNYSPHTSAADILASADETTSDETFPMNIKVFNNESASSETFEEGLTPLLTPGGDASNVFHSNGSKVIQQKTTNTNAPEETLAVLNVSAASEEVVCIQASTNGQSNISSVTPVEKPAQFLDLFNDDDIFA